MRKSFVLGAMFCLFAMSVAVSAQGEFAGDWTLDKEKSELGERSRVKSMTMNVTQSDTELTYERKVEREEGGQGGGGRGGRGPRGGGNAGAVTYNLEGEETTATTPRGEAKLTAKKLEGDKLELTRSQSFEGRMGAITIKTVETWELSEDGKTLTVSSETETPRGARNSKMVFSKS